MLTSVTAMTPFNGAQQVAVGSNITVTFDVALKASSVNSSTIQLRDASNNAVSAAITLNGAGTVITIDPTANLTATNNFYYVKVVSGASGVMSTANVAMTSDYNFAFTTGTPVFNDNTIINGLTAPTNLRFASDGRIFVSEKSGIIKEYDSLSDTTPTIVADLRTQVHNYWDRGLLGMELDPGFASGRPYIYVLYAADASIGGTAPIYGSVNGTSDPGTGVPAGTGQPISGRLSKLTIGAGNVMVGPEQVLINDWAQQFPSHSIGDLHFGPDGFLYATAGDGASFNDADYGQYPGINDPVNEGGALRAQDIRSSGDPTGLSGALIRIDPDTGLAAPDNPNSSSSDLNNRRIVAYGMRNPFRFTIRPGTNEIWIGDVGWNTWEEIDRVISPTDSNVENFGWPAYEGNFKQSGYDALDKPLLESLYANPSLVTAPYFGYQHSAKIVSGSVEPTGGSSISGEAFYTTGQYPSAYDGALFFADYSRKTIYVAYRGANGLPDMSTVQLFKLQSNGSVYLTMGPNGDLFYVDMDLGRIGRFTFNSNNTSPVARITVDKQSGPTPLVVNFDATTSSDADAGDTLTYAWDLDGDGNFNDSNIAKPTYTYNNTGSFSAKVLVTDRGGLTSIATVVITANGITNVAPTPIINLPSGSVNWKVGDIITFAGTATDAIDGTIPASGLSWELDLIHANASDPTSRHTHVIQTFSGVSGGSFTAPDHEYPSWLELKLTATDSGGLSSFTVLRLDPLTTTITVTANLVGVVVGLNDESTVGPFSRQVITGGANTVGAPPTFASGANGYNFTGWSDGGAITHSFTAPAGSITLTANYTAAGPNTKLSGTVIGTDGSFVGGDSTKDKAFDGDFNTFFDAPEAAANGTWVGLDLGTATRISQINFAARSTFEDRMIGGRFQGSNTADFSSGVVELYAIPTAPPAGSFTTVGIAETTQFRYVRYLSPDASWGNVAEIEFYTPTASVPAPAAPSGLVASATLATQVNLLWADNASNETGFMIERKTGAAGIWSTLATINTPNLTSYSDTTVAANTQYVYRVSAFNGTGATASGEATITTPAGNPVKLTGTYIGTAGSFQGAGNTGTKAFDGSLTTYFDAPEASGGNGNWVGLDLGAAKQINQIKYAPRNSFASRMVGGLFQGSNTADFSSGVVTLYTITTAPTQGLLTTVAISNPGTFRYVRYLSPNGGWGNVAEVEFYTPSGAAPATPAAPSALVATAASATQINLVWADNANNETGFKVQRKTGAAGTYATIATIATPNTTTFSDTTAAAGTQYYYNVVAYVTGGSDSTASNEANATTAPAAPSTLVANAVSPTQINLTWADNSTTETGFKVQRKTGLAGTYATIATIATPNTTSYSDTTGLTASTQYYYRVFAYQTNAPDSVASNEANATTLATTPPTPAAPTALAATAVSASQINLLWTDNASNENGFKIQRKTGAAGTYATIATIATPNATTYSDTTALAGTQYFYLVTAYVTGGSDSTASNEASATTAPAAPGTLVATAVSTTQINLTWADNSSTETGFKIQRKTGVAGTYATIATIATPNTTSYSNTTGLTAGTQYYYRVFSYQAGAPDSAASNEANAATQPATPAAPTALTATATSSSQINLAWTDNASNETGFKVLRKTGAAGTYATIATIATPNTTSYSNTGLTAGTQYYYQVVAYVTGGSDSAASNEANATTTGITTGSVVREYWSGVSGNTIDKVPVTTTPTSTSILTTLEIPTSNTANTADRIRGYIVAPTTGNYVFWIAGDDASELWLSPTSDPAGKVRIAYVANYTASRAWTSNASQKSAVKALVAGQSYYFEVLHKQGGGGSNLAVGWSKPGQATTTASEVIPGSALATFGGVVAPAAPTTLSAVTQSASSILINWTDNANNESGFRIERSTAGGSFAEIGTVGPNVTTYTNTGLLASTTYTYRVRSYNSLTTSAYTNTATATTTGTAVVTTYLSDLAFVGTPINQWGPVERDKSNGENGAGDGKAITLKGVTYAKGLGVHAYSEITYNLNGGYKNFLSDIGLDDEKTTGSVAFQVWLDGVLAYDSGLITTDSAVQSINLSVTGVNQLKLIVTDGGDGVDSDHADWAGARLTN